MNHLSFSLSWSLTKTSAEWGGGIDWNPRDGVSAIMLSRGYEEENCEKQIFSVFIFFIGILVLNLLHLKKMIILK